ncbi:hypothetical protein EYF80_021777 [Liparis tanakae]|uniref:Uncharacterized protein n=1 Tax=Liparis tanakae TaxID=230148 RepID=A0A4Z2HRQ3_9TELE|nr:hypothetical protein EYF80_021777 [Liparis tanakae]
MGRRGGGEGCIIKTAEGKLENHRGASRKHLSNLRDGNSYTLRMLNPLEDTVSPEAEAAESCNSTRGTRYISDEIPLQKAGVGGGKVVVMLESGGGATREQNALILLANDGGCKCGTCLVTERHSLHDNSACRQDASSQQYILMSIQVAGLWPLPAVSQVSCQLSETSDSRQGWHDQRAGPCWTGQPSARRTDRHVAVISL